MLVLLMGTIYELRRLDRRSVRGDRVTRITRRSLKARNFLKIRDKGCKTKNIVSKICTGAGNKGACCNLVGLGSILQAGIWQVRFPMRSMEFQIS
jgi:hypothetical protein